MSTQTRQPGGQVNNASLPPTQSDSTRTLTTPTDEYRKDGDSITEDGEAVLERIPKNVAAIRSAWASGSNVDPNINKSLENLINTACQQEKEELDVDSLQRDLVLASEIGQSLLQQNQELQVSLAAALEAQRRAEQERDKYQSELLKCQKTIEDAEIVRENAEKARDAARKEVEDLERSFDKVSGQVRRSVQIQDEVAALNLRVIELESTKQKLEEQLDAANRELRQVTSERGNLWQNVQELHDQIESLDLVNKKQKATYDRQSAEYLDLINRLHSDKQELTMQIKEMTRNAPVSSVEAPSMNQAPSTDSLVQDQPSRPVAPSPKEDTRGSLTALQTTALTLQSENDRLHNVIMKLENALSISQSETKRIREEKELLEARLSEQEEELRSLEAQSKLVDAGSLHGSRTLRSTLSLHTIVKMDSIAQTSASTSMIELDDVAAALSGGGGDETGDDDELYHSENEEGAEKTQEKDKDKSGNEDRKPRSSIKRSQQKSSSQQTDTDDLQRQRRPQSQPATDTATEDVALLRKKSLMTEMTLNKAMRDLSVLQLDLGGQLSRQTQAVGDLCWKVREAEEKANQLSAEVTQWKEKTESIEKELASLKEANISMPQNAKSNDSSAVAPTDSLALEAAHAKITELASHVQDLTSKLSSALADRVAALATVSDLEKRLQSLPKTIQIERVDQYVETNPLDDSHVVTQLKSKLKAAEIAFEKVTNQRHDIQLDLGLQLSKQAQKYADMQWKLREIEEERKEVEEKYEAAREEMTTVAAARDALAAELQLVKDDFARCMAVVEAERQAALERCEEAEKQVRVTAASKEELQNQIAALKVGEGVRVVEEELREALQRIETDARTIEALKGDRARSEAEVATLMKQRAHFEFLNWVHEQLWCHAVQFSEEATIALALERSEVVSTLVNAAVETFDGIQERQDAELEDLQIRLAETELKLEENAKSVTKYAEELEATNQSLESSRHESEQLRNLLVSKLHILQQKIIESERKKAQTIEQMLKEFQSKYGEEVEKLQGAHQTELEALVQERSSLQTELEEARAKNEADEAEWRARYEDAQRSYKSALEAIQSRVANAISEGQLSDSGYESRIAGLHAELEETKRVYQTKVDTLTSQLEAVKHQLAETQAKHAAEIAEYRAKMEEMESQIKLVHDQNSAVVDDLCERLTEAQMTLRSEDSSDPSTPQDVPDRSRRLSAKTMLSRSVDQLIDERKISISGAVLKSIEQLVQEHIRKNQASAKNLRIDLLRSQLQTTAAQSNNANGATGGMNKLEKAASGSVNGEEFMSNTLRVALSNSLLARSEQVLSQCKMILETPTTGDTIVYGDEDPSSTSAEAKVADLQALVQDLEAKLRDSEALRAAEVRHAAKVNDIVSRLSEEELRNARSSSSDEDPINRVMDLETKLRQVEESHEAELQKLTGKLSEAMQEAEDKYANEIRDMADKMKGALDSMQQQHKQEVEQLNGKLAEALQQLEVTQEGHIKEAKELGVKVTELQAQLRHAEKTILEGGRSAQKLQEDVESKEKELHILKARLSESTAQLQQSHNNRTCEKATQLPENEPSQPSEKDAMRLQVAQVQEKLRAIGSQHIQAQREIGCLKQISAEYAKEIETLRSQLSTALLRLEKTEAERFMERTELSSKADDLRRSLSSQLDLATTLAREKEEVETKLLQVESEMQKLQRQYTGAKSEITALNAKLLDVQKEMNRLKQVSEGQVQEINKLSVSLSTLEEVQQRQLKEKEDLSSMADGLHEDLRYQLQSVAELTGEKQELLTKISGLEQKMSLAHQELKAARDTWIQIATEREELESKVGELQQDLQQAHKQLLASRDELSSLNEIAGKDNEKMQALSAQISNSLARLNEAQAEKQKLSSKADGLQKTLQSQVEIAVQLAGEKESLLKRVADLEQKLQDATEQYSSEVSGLKEASERRDQQIQQLSSELSDSQSRLDEVQTIHSKRTQQLASEADNLRNELESTVHIAKQHAQEVESLKTQLAELQDRLRIEIHEHLQVQKEVVALKETCSAQENELRELRSQLHASLSRLDQVEVEYTSEKQTLLSKAESLQSDFQKRVDSAEATSASEKTELQSRISELEAHLREVDQERLQAETEASELKETATARVMEIEAFKGELSTVLSRLERAEQERLADMAELSSKAHELQQALQSQRDISAKLDRENHDLRSKLSEAERCLSEATQQQLDFQREITNLQETSRGYVRQIESLSTQLSSTLLTLEEAQKEEEEPPTKPNDLPDRLRSNLAMLESLVREKSVLEAKVTELEAQSLSIEKKQSEIDDLRLVISSRDEEIDDLRSIISRVSSNLQQSNENHQRYEEKIGSTLDCVQARLRMSTDALQRVQVEALSLKSEVGEKERFIESLQKQLSNALNDLRKLDHKNVLLQDSAKSKELELQQTVTRLQKQLEDVSQQHAQEVKALKAQLSKLDQDRTILSSSKQDLREMLDERDRLFESKEAEILALHKALDGLQRRLTESAEQHDQVIAAFKDGLQAAKRDFDTSLKEREQALKDAEEHATKLTAQIFTREKEIEEVRRWLDEANEELAMSRKKISTLMAKTDLPVIKVLGLDGSETTQPEIDGELCVNVDKKQSDPSLRVDLSGSGPGMDSEASTAVNTPVTPLHKDEPSTAPATTPTSTLKVSSIKVDKEIQVTNPTKSSLKKVGSTSLGTKEKSVSFADDMNVVSRNHPEDAVWVRKGILQFLRWSFTLLLLEFFLMVIPGTFLKLANTPTPNMWSLMTTVFGPAVAMLILLRPRYR
ncbi:hypothetical protein HK102_004410 [Quaeritorhiza haematococci]|nr:hypothetical protein HK102_004410 [Quaeritorhiza haematococci]